MAKRSRLSLALVFCFFAWIPRADARTPTEQVRETIEQVVVAANGSAGENPVARLELMRRVLMPRFDFFEMSRQSLGKHWNAVGERQQEFVTSFAEFLGNAYLGRIVSYKDEEIRFLGERVERDRAEVATRVVPRRGEPLTVNYRLHRVDDQWKIYDVVVEEISLIGNYRAQFSRILANGTFDDLMRRLREKGPTSRP
ncbi:MAG TPA: ABC transporter substrate-binding protein [candidate division Zixibacteria bacterium]|nr:ABC transporter substrate-binding protein [candidate division Zixibacteria bacterium]